MFKRTSVVSISCNRICKNLYNNPKKKSNGHFPRCEPMKYTTLWNSWPLFVENCSVHYALQVLHDRKFSVDKHCQSTQHHKALLSTPQQRQQLLSIPTASFDWNDYVGKVTAAFLSADIFLDKLNNSDLQALFKYVGQKAPSESACQKQFDNMGKCEVNQFAIFSQIRSFSWSSMKLIFQGPNM